MYHKKRRLSLIFIFVFVLLSIGYIIPSDEFQYFIKEQFEKKLSELYKADVSIKKVSGGILSGLSFENVKIAWKGAGAIDSLKAERITTTLSYFNLLKPGFIFQGNIFLTKASLQLKRYLRFPFSHSIISIQEFSLKANGNGNGIPNIVCLEDDQLVIDNLRHVQFDLANVSLKVTTNSVHERTIEILGVTPEKPYLNKFFLKDYSDSKKGISVIQFDLVDFSLLRLDVLSPHFEVLSGKGDVHLVITNNVVAEGFIKLKDANVCFDYEDITKNAVLDMNVEFSKDKLSINWIDFFYENLKLQLKGWIEHFYSDPNAHLDLYFSGSENDMKFTIFGPLDNLESELVLEFPEESKLPFSQVVLNSTIEDVLLRYDGLRILGLNGQVALGENNIPIPYSGAIQISPEGLHIEKLTLFDSCALEGKVVLQPRIFLDLLSYCKDFSLAKVIELVTGKSSEFGKDIILSSSMKVIGDLQDIVFTPQIEIATEHGAINMEMQVSRQDMMAHITAHDLLAGNFAIDLDLLIQKKSQDKTENTVFDLILNELTINGVALPKAAGELHYDSDSNKLLFSDIKVGKSYLITGFYDLGKNEIDLTVTFKESDVLDLSFFMKKTKKPVVAGVLNGYLRIAGPITYPSIEGKIKLEKGSILGVPFDMAIYEFDGAGTVVDLKNSRLIRGKYQTLIKGYIDFKLPNVFQNVKFHSDERSAYLAGFDIEKSDYADEYTVTRGLVDKWNIRFLSTSDDIPATGEDSERDASLELEFEMDDNQNFFFRIEEEVGSFGIKRKYEF